MTNFTEVYRKATDISSKIQAAFAGGVTTGGVASVVAAINPNWDAPAWLIGLITLAGALLFGYLKKEKVAISTIQQDGTVVQNGTLDLAELPMPDWIKEQLDAQDNLGLGDEEQPAGIEQNKH